MAKIVTVVTSNDLGDTLEVLDSKLEVALSQEADNLLVIKEDGLYALAPTLGSMAQEDVEDYLTKAEIERDYATKADVALDLADYVKTAELGDMAYEDKEDYYTAQDVDGIIASLPADNFLKNAELINDGATLRLTMSEGDPVDVNLADLIPVKTGAGLRGNGTEANPIEVDVQDMIDALGLGTMAFENADDYYTKTDADETFLALDDLTVTLKALDGTVIGVLSEAPAAS